MKTNFLKIAALLLLTITIGFTSCTDEKEEEIVNPTATEYAEANGEVTVTDKGEGTGTITWTADKEWILNGFVFVNEGQTLTIEAGTLVKGSAGTGENASALIVARGGKVMAVGTATSPIIFTAEADNAAGTGVDLKAKGLWGGIIILGKATTNNSTLEKAIEGIPTEETRGLYGGTDDNDNSGVIKYVSIRHGGTDIGEGNEINGLTLGAVGAGTVFDYIEVIANADDGIEFFGGKPEVKHAIIAYCGDDSFDYDEGFSGKGQFWCTIQDGESDRCGEHDGGPSDNETGDPYAMPTIYNATYIGQGIAGETRVITFRDNAGGTYANSIFVDQTKGIDIEWLQNDAGEFVQCSYKMFTDGLLKLKNNVFYNVADGNAAGLFKITTPKNDLGEYEYLAPDADVTTLVNYFENVGNLVVDPGVTATNPVPTNSQTGNLATYPTDSFFETVGYKGAFGSTNWATGWTLSFK